jgi:hypothetical protein
LEANYTKRVDTETGREVYSFTAVVNCSVRETPPVAIQEDNASKESNESKIPEAEEEVSTKPEDTADVSVNNSLVSGDSSQFVTQTWRLISAVQAWPHSGFRKPQCVDYAYLGGEVLKQAISLINSNRIDLIWNHSDDAHDVAGYVHNATWEEPGDIPCGVNAELVVDPEYDRKAALGLKSGLLRSGSIGINMECIPSHPSMEMQRFIGSQGEVVDGDLVRWLPIKLTGVRHMAILPAGTGADPYAGRRYANQTEEIAEYIVGRNEAIDTDKTVEEQKENENQVTGGKIMDEKWVALLSSLAKGLGVEVVLAENSEVPEGLEERLSKKIEGLTYLQTRHNKICQMIEELGEKANDGAAPSTFEETFSLLEDKIRLAAHGERLLAHYRKEAQKWFDSAKMSLGKTDLSDSEKRMRSRISKSEDLDYLEDIIAEYRDIAEANLNSSRISEGVDINPDNQKKELRNRDIEASSNKLFRK